MAENSGIEWTHHTFNPWIGCAKVSAACDHCYAEAWDKRFGGTRWGPHAPRKRTSVANWRKPLAWNKKAEAEGRRYRVFCASLADVFDNHKSIQPEWRGDLWDLIKDTPHLDWLLLTKRPQNIARYIPTAWRDKGCQPNVWLGTTVEDQTEAERRIPHLLSVPAAVHFLSCEPLLGHIDLSQAWHGEGALDPECWGECAWCSKGYPPLWNCRSKESADAEKGCSGLDWIITGGESGPRYRPADPEWFRSLRDQCAAAGVPFLFKQWEGRNQREIKAKGRALDGVVHDGYPRGAEHAM